MRFDFPDLNVLLAPKGRFRLVVIDTFESPTAQATVGDFEDRTDALREARARRREMIECYVFDEWGKRIESE